jgi:hypothetical protein
MSSFPRVARVFVVLALAGTTATLPSSADAAQHARTTQQAEHNAKKPTRKQQRALALARARAAAAARVRAAALAAAQLRMRKNKRLPKRASIVFDKNWKNPYDSRVIFRAWAKTGPKGHKKWVLIEQASWRAGSGFTRRTAKDECRRDEGWLPNGSYSFVQHNRRKAPMINGRVFELEPKDCRNGTRRQLLFIHTEQKQDNTQCRNAKGDDRCRWEVPVYNDYRSNGCIKMSPQDLKSLTRRFHHYFKAGVRYPTSVVRVRVVS